jgi:sucrose-6-phosphate hydrolase SacC (GH32 family)
MKPSILLVALLLCCRALASSDNDATLLSQSSFAGTAVIAKRYLNFPISDTGKKFRTTVLIDGAELGSFNIALASQKPDWWAFIDVGRFRGENAEIKVTGAAPTQPVYLQSDTIPGTEDLYHEQHRPQIHFTSRRGWLNDPNGLVYYKGQYHLFYQHNPMGMLSDNVCWGHAVSPDLFHWTELPGLLFPNSLTGESWTGAAFIDARNQLGLKKGPDDTIVAFYLRTRSGLSYAYSNDGGLTFNNYSGNPVVTHPGDRIDSPKPIWYPPGKYWVAAVFDHNARPDDPSGQCYTVAFYKSDDLKTWRKTSDIGRAGFLAECPDLFPLPVDGNKRNQKWVLILSDGSYIVGMFDGRVMRNEAGAPATIRDIQTTLSAGGDYYATMSWSNIPPSDGRRIQIAWMNDNATPYGDNHFNQQMSLPLELTLRKTDAGAKLRMFPVRELNNLRGKEYSWTNTPLTTGANLLSSINTSAPLDVEADLKVSDAAKVEFSLRGYHITYEAGLDMLTCSGPKGLRTRLLSRDGVIHLRMIIDRFSIEVFGNDGELYVPILASNSQSDPTLSLLLHQGQTTIQSLRIHELNSIWP